MTKRETLAYLAGALDSDGSIGIKRSTYSMRVTGDSSQPTYSERIMLRQVTDEIPVLLQSMFGGSLYLGKPQTQNGRALYSWQATDLKACNALKLLLPFLRVKKLQTRNAIKLRKLKRASLRYRVRTGRGHIGGAKRPKRIGAAMEALYLEAKRLNRTGAE